MAQNDASIFLERCASDEDFRAESYKAEGPQEFLGWVQDSGYSFSWHELENASRRLKLRAKDEGEAAFVEELKLWYEFLSGGAHSGGASMGAASDCSPLLCASCASAGSCSSGSAGAVGSRAAVRPGVEASPGAEV